MGLNQPARSTQPGHPSRGRLSKCWWWSRPPVGKKLHVLHVSRSCYWDWRHTDLFGWRKVLAYTWASHLTSVGCMLYYLSPVYTIQLVVNPIWQSVVSCIQTFNLLSNPFDNRFDKQLYRVYSRLPNRLYNPVWQPVERTAVRSTRYTIQRVVKLVVSCKQTSTRFSNWVWQPVTQPVEWTMAVCSTLLSNQLSNPLDNQLDVCLHDTAGCQTGLTTGCIV